MRRVLTLLALTAVAALSWATSAGAVTITKAPDQGATWHPLSGNGGTYVYANSFVSSATGVVSDLGTWLREYALGTHEVRFQVVGSVAGDPLQGPDMTNVLATTAILTPAVDGNLNFFNAAPVVSSLLTAGETYWFAATVVGLDNTGAMQVGGHTQNSVYADNGTFWYSNDPNGINFDGPNNTPEMAFSVTVDESVVPEPTAALLFGVGFAVVGLSRKRRS